MNRFQKKSNSGFTLLEILIALFIFTLVSLALSNAFYSVMTSQVGTENKAERLREMQMTLLLMSREIAQTINRPIISDTGKEEPAFVGTSRYFIFTHLGFANPTGELVRSNLQRTSYGWNEHKLLRLTWDVLDRAPTSLPQTREMLTNIEAIRFEYLDDKNHFYDKWPVDGETNQPLPRGVRIYLTIPQWGKMSQLYLIEAESNKVNSSSREENKK